MGVGGRRGSLTSILTSQFCINLQRFRQQHIVSQFWRVQKYQIFLLCQYQEQTGEKIKKNTQYFMGFYFDRKFKNYSFLTARYTPRHPPTMMMEMRTIISFIIGGQQTFIKLILYQQNLLYPALPKMFLVNLLCNIINYCSSQGNY